MKKNTFLSLILILNFSAFSQKYFEGMVEYETSFQSFNSGVPENELKVRFGSKVRFFQKNGDYIREYIDDAGYSLRKYIYRNDSNFLYELDIFNPDTIYYSSASEKLFDNYQITKGANDTILNCICTSNVITSGFFDKAINDSMHFKSEYYFCNQMPVNPDYFKNIYLWYDVIKNQKSIALKFTEEIVGFFKITYTAIKIDYTPLVNETFEIDKKRFLKKRSVID